GTGSAPGSFLGDRSVGRGAGGDRRVGFGGGLGVNKNPAGHDAQDECGGSGKKDGKKQRHRRTRHGGDRSILRRAGIESGDDAQVIEAGESAVDEAQDGQPDESGVDSGGKDVELAEESAGEGNSNERDEEEGHGSAEQRGAIGETAVIVDEGKAVIEFAGVADDG